MKKWLLAMLLALWPAAALAQVEMTELADAASGSAIAVFEVAQDGVLDDMARMAVSMQIEARFAQSAAMDLVRRPGAQIAHRGMLYQDGAIISMARIWQGDLPGGGEGSEAAALTVNAQNGFEIYLDELFDDPDAAIAAMEAIIQRDVLDQMDAYMEYADLLPMPRSSFYADETGLTVFWPADRYAHFDGSVGYVTFFWHEIAGYIGESSPVYALSRPQAADAAAILRGEGFTGGHEALSLYAPLDSAMEAYALTDEPDYTAVSVLYPVSDPALRGTAVETDKYAETTPEDTPVSAVRRSRASWHGLTTGQTTREEIVALLGAPEETVVYGGDAAYDMLLEPGESLVYACGFGGRPAVLEAHLDEDGVLSCLLLRDAMPETLY